MVELGTYQIQTDGNEDAGNHFLYCLNRSLGHSFLTVRVEKCASGRGPEGEKKHFQLFIWSAPTLHSIIPSINYENFTHVVMSW